MMDTSFLTGNAPTPLLDPLTIQARKIAVRNALAAGALQDQQIQAGALANKQAQSSYDANQQFRALLNNGSPAAPASAPAPAPQTAGPAGPQSGSPLGPMAPPPQVNAGVPPGGAPLPAAPAFDPSSNSSAATPPTQMSGAAPTPGAAPAVPNAPQTAAHDIPDSQILGIFGQQGYALIHARNEANKLAADAQASADTHNTAVNNYWGSVAYGLSGVNYDPGAVQAAIQKAQADHMDKTPQFQQFAQNANNPAALQQLGTIAMRQSQEQQTLLNERTTASAKASEAQTASNNSTQTILDKKRADFLSALGAVPKDANANATWSALIAANPDLAQSLKIPPTYSSAAQAFAKGQGQTSNEQVTTGLTASHNTALEANENRARTIDAGRLQVEQGRLSVERQNAGLDANGNPITAANANPTAVALTQGKIDPVSARAMLRKNPGLYNQALAVDPSFDETKLENRYNFNKRLTDYTPTEIGGQALALNKLVHHADLLYDTIDALNNHSLVPGNQLYNTVATTFGGVPSGNFDTVRDFVTHEAAKLAQGGVPNEADIKASVKNLNSAASPDQLKQRLGKVLEVAGGAMQAINEQGRQYGMSPDFTVLGPQGKAVMTKHGIDPETLKPMAPAPAPAAVPAHGIPDIGATFNGGKVLKVTRIN